MAKKTDFALSGSVQKKNGKLYLVYPHYDPIKKVTKYKWKGMGLLVGEKKTIIEKTRRELLHTLEAEEIRLREGYNNPENYPLIEFLTTWLETVHKYKIQQTTYQDYQNKINGKIKAYFGEKITLDDCKPRLIHGFYEFLRSDGVTERTVLHYHNLLHTAFEYAVRQEIFEFNPMNRVERPQEKKFVGSFYSVDELQTLLSLAENETIYIPIVLAAYYGVRRSEALGLSWDNVDFDKKEIRICQKLVEEKQKGKSKLTLSDEMKTEGSRRTLPLLPDVEEILLKHKERQESYRKQFRRGYSTKHLDMVCVDQMGNLIKPNYVTSRFPKILKKYGLRAIRFHDLRHTCASLLVTKNINMKVIQVWLGHSNMSTTADIYSHLDTNAKAEAGKAIESLFRANESED